MAERNVGREIAIILVATVVLGGGFAAWLVHSIEMPKPIELAPSLSGNPEGTEGADTNADELRELASAWGRRLAAHDYEGARELMAAPLRDATTTEQLAALITANAYLAGTESVTILRTTEQRTGSDPRATTLRSTGVLASKAGAVELTLHCVREPEGIRIVSALLAGVPVLQAVDARPAETSPASAPSPPHAVSAPRSRHHPISAPPPPHPRAPSSSAARAPPSPAATTTSSSPTAD